MNCPVCKTVMVEKDFGGVLVDVCENGCKGIWFDWLELVKLDESNEGMGAALKAALAYDRTNDENRPPLKCPKCCIPMKEHKYKLAKIINVDECYSCGGFFLDSGELKDIRDNIMSESEQEEYLNNLVDSVPEYENALAEQEKKLTRAKAANRYTRFMRLSNYLGR